MLEQKDLDAISKIVTKSEGLLLDEMERYDRKYEKRFNNLIEEIEEIKGHVKKTENENETINTLLRIIENLEKRVSELERKTA